MEKRQLRKSWYFPGSLCRDVAGLDLEFGFLCFQPRCPSVARTACLGLGAEIAEDQTTATVPGLVGRRDRGRV